MTRRLWICLLAAACSSRATPSAAPLPAPTSSPAPAGAVAERATRTPWENDPRWPGRLREIESASAAAFARLRAETGLAFEKGREPTVVFDDKAPPSGDAASRFVGGVRRPLVRVPPRALLSGEFLADGDLAPLLVEGAILVGAGERDPPAWVVRGFGVVVGDAFELRLHRRALAGDAVRVREEDLFAASPTDPLAAAARAKALLRIARAERPAARFLDLIFSGRTEDAALAEMGVARRDFLDAAAETERSRAARELATDPTLSALRAARAALALREPDRADGALAPVAEALTDPSVDPWLVADARLCLAQIAMARGETKNATAALAVALASSKVVRTRDARVLAAWTAARAGGGLAQLRALVADWPEAAGDEWFGEALGVPASVHAKAPGLALDLVSDSSAKRQAAATKLAATGGKECAPALRTLAADPEAAVRRSAVAALAVVLGRGADDDVEAATRDADAAVRRTALDLLAVSDKKRAAKRAAEMKSDPDAGVRARAVELAGAK